MALRTDGTPFRPLWAIAGTAAVLALFVLSGATLAAEPEATKTKPVSGSTSTASAPVKTTATATTTTTATTTSKPAPASTATDAQRAADAKRAAHAKLIADAKRAAAKKAQHTPVMAIPAGGTANGAYPWTAPGKSATPKTPSQTVTAGVKPTAQPQTKVAKSWSTTTKTATSVKPATPNAATPKGTQPSQAGATFKERMARTTVTPPVIADGAKASNTIPAPATPKLAPNAAPAAVAPKLATVPSKPLSPPPGAKPAWHFRQVVAASSTTSKTKDAVALTTVKATASSAPSTSPATVAPKAVPTTPKPGTLTSKSTVAVAPRPATAVPTKPTATATRPGAPMTSAAKPGAIATRTAPVPGATTPPAKPTVTKPMAKVALKTPVPSPAFRTVVAGSSTSKGSSTPVAAKAKGTPAPQLAAKATTTVKTATLATTGSKTTAAKGAKHAPLTTSVQSLGARFMEQREQYVYNSLNRRDPYASLVSGSFEGEVGTPLLDVSSMKLVGIVWGGADKFALVEDGHGHGFVLRVGDPVLNGYVAGLTKEELIVKQSSYGDTQTVTIQLQRKEGASNAQ